MQFADAASLPFRDPGTRHREGNIRFKYLLRGIAGAAQNYELTLVRTDDTFHGPPHRHNFDQIRYVVSGTFGEPGVLELRAGEVGYYPEGTPYRINAGTSEVLLLQFGGASGAGFTHYDQLRATYPVLAQKGEFRDGIFRWHEPPAGTAKQQDGYEALWELINGKKLTYPKQRYRQPVLMVPAGFDWVPVAEGLSQRMLGRFTEREIGVAQLRLAAGADVMLDAGPTIRLLYVLEGSGSLDGRPVQAGCALELPVRSRVAARADEALTLLALDLPRFDAPAVAASADAEQHAEQQ